jgi:membrane-bound metal-dependent hydrolase YbcI (DUF457 family)
VPSSIAHGLAGAAIASVLYRGRPPRGVLPAAVVCAVLPDVDAIGRPFGMEDVGWLGGHRGLTHGLPVAVVLGAAMGLAGIGSDAARHGWPHRLLRAACLALAIASHGLLDTMTVYGVGVALLSPISTVRLTAPWHPFTGIADEVVLVWLPALVVLGLPRAWRRFA